MKQIKTAIKIPHKSLTLATVAIMSTTFLGACSTMDRLAEIGQPPKLEKIENPVTRKDYKAVSMPMPAPKIVKRHRNSLWGGERQTFFKDQRANEIGDILTVLIDIEDEADIENETTKTRSSREDAQLNALLGFELDLSGQLPEALDNTDLIDADATSLYKGKGKAKRDEAIKMKLAATIVQKLPNGNMVIQGKQEVRVNFEKRILEIAGIIRPEDISTENTISYDQIAEARISYGGKGHLTDMQQPRYGQQAYDILFPF